mgnify:CR=1 FL=1
MFRCSCFLRIAEAALISSGVSFAAICAMWCGVVVLVSVGVAAALGRGMFATDLVARVEPFRTRVLRGLDREDPRAAERPAEARRFDGSFAANPRATLLHVLPGGLFLRAAPLG